MTNSRGAMVVLVPASVVQAAAEEGRLARPRLRATQVIEAWARIGREAEARAGVTLAKAMIRLGDRVGSLDGHRQRPMRISGDLVAVARRIRRTSHLAMWATLGMVVDAAAIDVRRIRQEIRGRRGDFWLRIAKGNQRRAWEREVLLGKATLTDSFGFTREMVKSAVMYDPGVDAHERAMGIDPSKKILLDLSCGKVSLMEATHLLGFQDAGYTLRLMAEEGLAVKRLSEETVKRQTAETLDALQECLRRAAKPGGNNEASQDD